MPQINLPTGKVIYISTYDYYFALEDGDMDEFYQSCVADDLGRFVDDPFSQKIAPGKLEIEDFSGLDDIAEDDYE